MKIEELRVLSNAELLQRVQELKHESFQLRLRKANDHFDKTHLARRYRREIAQCLTVINERDKAMNISD